MTDPGRTACIVIHSAHQVEVSLRDKTWPSWLFNLSRQPRPRPDVRTPKSGSPRIDREAVSKALSFTALLAGPGLDPVCTWQSDPRLDPHAAVHGFVLSPPASANDAVGDDDHSEAFPFSLYADLRPCHPILNTLV